MATFGELQTKASLRLKDPDNQAISASSVAAAINDAIAFWMQKRYWFNEFEETVTLVQNDPNLPVLTNTPLYLFPKDGIVIDYASTRWPLRHISSSEYDDINVQGRGVPFAYTYRAQGYEVYWYPDNDYTAIVRGIRAYSRFAEDGTDNNLSNDFTIEAPNLILYDALSRLFAEFRQDDRLEAYYTARSTSEYNSLQYRTRRSNATGRVRVEGL